MFVLRYDIYAMKVDWRKNCYNCREFRHIARYCRNQSFLEQERRVEYESNYNMDNLKEEENLVVLN